MVTIWTLSVDHIILFEGNVPLLEYLNQRRILMFIPNYGLSLLREHFVTIGKFENSLRWSLSLEVVFSSSWDSLDTLLILLYKLDNMKVEGM